jgi:hypothetical protein
MCDGIVESKPEALKQLKAVANGKLEKLNSETAGLANKLGFDDYTDLRGDIREFKLLCESLGLSPMDQEVDDKLRTLADGGNENAKRAIVSTK